MMSHRCNSYDGIVSWNCLPFLYARFISLVVYIKLTIRQSLIERCYVYICSLAVEMVCICIIPVLFYIVQILNKSTDFLGVKLKCKWCDDLFRKKG